MYTQHIHEKTLTYTSEHHIFSNSHTSHNLTAIWLTNSYFAFSQQFFWLTFIWLAHSRSAWWAFGQVRHFDYLDLSDWLGFWPS